MIGSYGVVAYGELPSLYDRSVADPFAALLLTPNPQLIYLIELYPFDPSTAQNLIGMAPFGGASFGEFNITYQGGVTRIYLSDYGFVTAPSDTPSSQYFIAQVDNPLQYETSILSGNDFGAGNQSFGSIAITNGNGKLDYLEKYYWASRRVVIKAGAKNFTYSQFSTVFDGLADSIEGDDDHITITIRDNRAKTDQLLVPMTYAGTGGLEGGADIATKAKPLCFGLVKNLEPVLVDAANLVYQIHDGSISSVDAVRDSGVALTGAGDVADITAAVVSAGQFKTQLSGGYIKLGSTPAGRITADVQGENTGGYVSTVGDIVKRIVKTRMGAISLDDTSIDAGSIARLNIAVPGSAGVYLPDRVTASEVIDALVLPIGGYWTFSRQGQLSIGVIDQPGTETAIITSDMIDESGIKVDRISPSWRISVGYAPVSIVQDGDELASGTLAADRAFVTEQFRYVTYEDQVIRAQNPQSVERTFQTRLANKSDAQALLTRLATIYSVKRRAYQVPLYRALFRLYIGDTVKLVYDRFSLSGGVTLLVVGIAEDAETGQTTLTLWG